MRRAMLFPMVLTAALTGCTSAPGQLGPPPEASAALARIPLSPYLAQQVTVTATVAGHSGTFLFDTGEGISSMSPEFAGAIGCHPWGRITGFRMSGERLDAPHCDAVVFELANQSFVANSMIIFDIMGLMGPDVPHVDGAIGLDLFADHVVTVLSRRELVIESDASLAARGARARELPVRLVRDAEGLSLAVNGAVLTPAGLAWFELDTGNGGSLVVANHIAPLLGLPIDTKEPIESSFNLANGITVAGEVRTRDLIMDGNVGAQFLNHWALTLDLRHGRAWLAPDIQ